MRCFRHLFDITFYYLLMPSANWIKINYIKFHLMWGKKIAIRVYSNVIFFKKNLSDLIQYCTPGTDGLTLISNTAV